MFKKLSSLFVSVLLIVTLSGCQTDSEPVPVSETDSVESVEVENSESTDTATAESVEVEVEASESAEVETSESTTAEVVETVEATVTSVSVVGTDFKFAPSSLSFTAGQTVQLTFQNNGGAPHNLVVEGTDIKTATIGGGETTTLTFVAPTAGTYTFYCGVGGHRDAGMTGNMTVQ